MFKSFEFLLIVLIAYIINYIGMSFVLADLDFRNWDMDSRILYIALPFVEIPFYMIFRILFEEFRVLFTDHFSTKK